jgi:hypothetical protein
VRGLGFSVLSLVATGCAAFGTQAVHQTPPPPPTLVESIMFGARMAAGVRAADVPVTLYATSPVVSTSMSSSMMTAIARDEVPISSVEPLSPSAVSPTTPPADPTQPKREVLAPRISVPAPAPKTALRLPDEIVVRAFDLAQPAFLRCFARAQRFDPTLTSIKLQLHLEINAEGAVEQATTDVEVPKLSACVALVARALRFAAPGRAAVVDGPLFFGN